MADGLAGAIPRIDRGASEFAAVRGAAVAVIERGPEWERLAAQARRTRTETEVLSRALDGGDQLEAVRRARSAAAEAFDQPGADGAVVATVNGRLVAVTTYQRTDGLLEVAGEGTTNPLDPVDPVADLAVQHTLARLAANEGLGVRVAVPPDPEAEARQQALGRSRTTTDARWWQADAEYGWSAGDTRRVVRDSAILDAHGVLPAAPRDDASRMTTYQAADIAEFLDTGGRIRVIRHADVPADEASAELGGHETAERIALTLGEATDKDWDDTFGTGADPARVNGLFSAVAERADGAPLAMVTFSDESDHVRVVRELSDTGQLADRIDNGALWAARSVAFAHASRRGLGVGWGTGGWDAAEIKQSFDRFTAVLGPLAAQLPPEPDAPQPVVTPEQVAERMRSFDAGAGDVVLLRPAEGDQLFGVQRQQALEAALAPNDAADLFRPGSEYFVHAFEPPAQNAGYPFVAVALRDGKPTAAVRFYGHQDRVVLDAAGALPGSATATEDLTAAIVEGPLRLANGRPLTGAAPEPVAAAYAEAGVTVLDHGPVSSVPGQVTLGLDGPSAARTVAAVDADRGDDRASPGDIQRRVVAIQRFAGSGAEVATLDHGSAADRRRAEYVRLATDGVGPDPAYTAAENAHRVTVAVVADGAPRAFVTVDSTPGQPITVVDASPEGDPTHEAALGWWLANHQERLGRPMEQTDAVRQSRPNANTDLAESKRLVAGAHNRLQDQLDHLATGAGSAYPSSNVSAIKVPDAAEATAEKGQPETAGAARPGPADAERSRPPAGHGRPGERRAGQAER